MLPDEILERAAVLQAGQAHEAAVGLEFALEMLSKLKRNFLAGDHLDRDDAQAHNVAGCYQVMKKKHAAAAQNEVGSTT